MPGKTKVFDERLVELIQNDPQVRLMYTEHQRGRITFEDFLIRSLCALKKQKVLLQTKMQMMLENGPGALDTKCKTCGREVRLLEASGFWKVTDEHCLVDGKPLCQQCASDTEGATHA